AELAGARPLVRRRARGRGGEIAEPSAAASDADLVEVEVDVPDARLSVGRPAGRRRDVARHRGTLDLRARDRQDLLRSACLRDEDDLALVVEQLEVDVEVVEWRREPGRKLGSAGSDAARGRAGAAAACLELAVGCRAA